MDKSVPDPEPIRFRIRNRSLIKQGISNIAMFEIFIEILMKDDERNVLLGVGLEMLILIILQLFKISKFQIQQF